MSTPELTPPPTPPSRLSAPKLFAQQGDALMSWLPGFVQEMTQAIGWFQQQLSLAYSSVSSSVLTVGNGTKTLTAEPGRGFVAGHLLLFTSRSNTTRWMIVRVSSYNRVSGAMSGEVSGDQFSGSGSHSDWDIGLAATNVSLATAAQVAALTATGVAMSPGSLGSAAAPQPQTYASTFAPDFSSRLTREVELNGNPTMATPIGCKAGFTYVLHMKQDATGGRQPVWPTNGAYDFGDAESTISPTPNSMNILTLYCYDAATPKFRAGISRAA